MIEVTTHIGALYVNLFISGCQSLKQKRTALKRLKHQIRAKFNVSVGELGGRDKWQAAALGRSMTGADSRYINGALESVLDYIDKYYETEVCEYSIEFY